MGGLIFGSPGSLVPKTGSTHLRAPPALCALSGSSLVDTFIVVASNYGSYF